ncbi:MAG: hypothetical protein RI952_1095 [Bacteroidota bacterium]|jgi:hypothetical protein
MSIYLNLIQKKLKIKLLILIAILFIACDPESAVNPKAKTNKLSIEFQHFIADSLLVLNSSTYSNSLEQNFTVDKFNYFISNIILEKTDGTTFTVPQDSSYFLIKTSNKASQKITLFNIPIGNYQKIKFTIGVDSARSCMPASFRKGSLDVGGAAADMYWTWNTGYIFLKLQCMPIIPKGGDSSAAIPYVYHIGGFGGLNNPTLNNIREVNLNFNTTLPLTENSTTAKIIIKTDALKVLEGSTQVNLATTPTVMLTPFSANIANNYQNMFSIIQIIN